MATIRCAAIDCTSPCGLTATGSSDLRFEGKGCAISVASASLMCEAVKGKRRDEIAHLFGEIHAVLTRHDAPVPEDLGKLAALSGVREFPVRVKCASLCWHTLNAALGAQRGDGEDRVAVMRTHDNEPFVLSRDVKAVMVPAGIEIELKSGQSGFITQALGGSFTLYMEGNLFRIAGADADAIGKDVVKAPELPPNATEDDVLALAWEQLRTCYDPEIPINIVDLGLIYECTVSAQPDGQRVPSMCGSR